MLRIDFETRSEIDLKSAGPWVYAEHESTEILCLAWKWDDRPVELWSEGIMNQWKTIDVPWTLRLALLGAEDLIEAHNVGFERAIYEKILVDRLGWPRINPKRFRCSAALASSYALPRALGDGGDALGLNVTKDAEGRRIMLKLCKPRKPSKNDKRKYFDDEEDFQKLFGYCQRDVESEKAISDNLEPLSPFELKVWRLEQKINARGVFCDLDAVRGALELIETLDRRAKKRTKEITKGKVSSPLQVGELRKWILSRGIPIPNLQRLTVEEFLKRDLPGDVRRVLDLRLSMSKSSTRKYKAMIDRASRDSRIRSLLLFNGAERTGRFSGTGIQIQNFPKGSLSSEMVEIAIEAIKERDLEWIEFLWSDPMSVFSSCLRGVLSAPPGKELIAADFSSIEARVLFWLAGQKDGLRMFREGADIYVNMAQAIFNAPASKIGPKKRDLGKRTVLGCGYQMGGPKFRETCRTQGGVIISEELSETAVRTYRERYPKVPELWSAIEKAAKATVGSGIETTVGKLGFERDNRFLYMKLPSGRRLCYYDPKIETVEVRSGDRVWDSDQLTYMGVNSQSKKWERLSSYGGKLTENATQATARDLLVFSMLNIEKAGFPIVLSIHDEIVSEIEEGSRSVEEFVEIMTRGPKWSKGIPIAAEGWRGKRFKK